MSRLPRALPALLVLSGCGEFAITQKAGEAYDDSAATPTPPPSSDTADEDSGDTAEDPTCDGAHVEPLTVYLSADDSNSQARATLARAAIEAGVNLYTQPRVWEYLNYYDFGFAPAEAGTLRIVPQMREHADEPGTYDVLVAVVAPAVDPDARRPLNLTFSVDTSGSMRGTGLEMAQATMSAIASELREGDIVSLVSWDDDTRILLDSRQVQGPDDDVLVAAIDGLVSGGTTNLSAGLVKAYDVASRNRSTGRTNRVVLMSDGGANTGVTDEDLIANQAEDGEDGGIYLLGVGSGLPNAYSDPLMDTVTDLGKGAYVYVDREAEARRSFTGARFLSNLEVAARDVRLSMTLPAGFVVTEFHGEQISVDPEDVIPQHLGPNDAMLYHMVLKDCGDALDGTETFDFSVDWQEPRSAASHTDSLTATVAEMEDAANTQVVKAHAIIAYAEALAAVWDQPTTQREAFLRAAQDVVEAAAIQRPEDADLQEIIGLLETYRGRF